MLQEIMRTSQQLRPVSSPSHSETNERSLFHRLYYANYQITPQTVQSFRSLDANGILRMLQKSTPADNVFIDAWHDLATQSALAGLLCDPAQVQKSRELLAELPEKQTSLAFEHFHPALVGTANTIPGFNALLPGTWMLQIHLKEANSLGSVAAMMHIIPEGSNLIIDFGTKGSYSGVTGEEAFNSVWLDKFKVDLNSHLLLLDTSDLKSIILHLDHPFFYLEGIRGQKQIVSVGPKPYSKPHAHFQAYWD